MTILVVTIIKYKGSVLRYLKFDIVMTLVAMVMIVMVIITVVMIVCDTHLTMMVNQ